MAKPIEVITLTVDQLEARDQANAERVAERVASRFDRVLKRYADMLEDATSAAGLKKHLTVREAALHANRKPDTIRKWIKDGMPSQKGRRGHIIDREVLDRWRGGAAKAA